MAIVKQLERINLDRDVPHSEAECTYSIITGAHGDKLLQIDTYGSKERQLLGKKSQSIRFSREAIDQLKTILAEI